MPKNMSVATIKDPEFINLKPSEISPFISDCEIKVFYLGKNRNRSFISKDVAIEMSKTLRGSPIVGYYSKDKEDFTDHGEEIIINSEGFKFNCLTKPYGFVAPNAKVWFKEFEDTDEFGNKVIRDYLMTTGYLWTKQYEEAQKVIEEGKPHSMELDDDTLEGDWKEDSSSHISFFIINDAIFDKLCILGDDVEPCFEGSSVTAPEISSTFTMDSNKFKKDLYTMMQQLRYALEGGQQPMDGKENKEQEQNTVNTSFEKEKEKSDTAEKEEKEKSDTSDKEEKEEDKDEKKNYSLLEEEFKQLKEKYSLLDQQYQELTAFKKNVEDKEKDQLIQSFYMLSDEDKKDVIENKAKYSLDEIESKLSVICFRKKVNFNLDNTDKNDNTTEDKPATTYNLDSSTGESVPAWISAIIKTQNERNR